MNCATCGSKSMKLTPVGKDLFCDACLYWLAVKEKEKYMDILDKIASMLDGREYAKETTPEIEQFAKLNGVVIAYGASDDLLELRGAVDDEIGAWEGVTVKFNQEGIISNKCEDEDCPYYKEVLEKGISVQLIWCPDDKVSWQFHTDILHKTFMIYEDGEPFCEGIVFELSSI